MSLRASCALLVSLTVAACAAPASPDGALTVMLPTAESAPPRASGDATAPTAHASASASTGGPVDPPAKPTRITVVEGTPQTLPDGTQVSAGRMTYAHLKDDGNLSICEVTVTRNGVTETKTLEREGAMTFTRVAGLRVGLDGVDPYHQPSSAFLVVGD